MKGFTPTGYGPRAGFRFPARMGFTGSTGAFTNVSPYVRRRAFANGGFVRQDTPRMKVDSIGDQGSGLVRRKRASNALDQESGGKTPLRPGYRTGGRIRKARKANGGMMSSNMRDMLSRAVANASATNRPQQPRGALGRALAQATVNARNAAQRPGADAGALSNADREYLARTLVAPKKRGFRIPTPVPRASITKERFYDKGGKVMKTYEHIPKPTYWQAFKDRAKELVGFGDDDPSAGLAKRAERELKSRTRKIDEAVDKASYSRGGKAKRMGYGPRSRVKKAEGGVVSRADARRIAERAVGEHVRYPAPKGHQGLKATC